MTTLFSTPSPFCLSDSGLWLVVPVASEDRSIKRDLKVLSVGNFKIGPPKLVLEATVVAVVVVEVVDVAFDAVAVVVVDFVEAVVALKHFWHMLLVAGLPVKPQLLIQRVKVSGTLKSVSSFSVF